MLTGEKIYFVPGDMVQHLPNKPTMMVRKETKTSWRKNKNFLFLGIDVWFTKNQLKDI